MPRQLKKWRNYDQPLPGVLNMAGNGIAPSGWIEIQRDDDYQPGERGYYESDDAAAKAVSPVVVGYNHELSLFVTFDSDLWTAWKNGAVLAVVVPDPRSIRTYEDALDYMLKHNWKSINKTPAWLVQAMERAISRE